MGKDTKLENCYFACNVKYGVALLFEVTYNRHGTHITCILAAVCNSVAVCNFVADCNKFSFTALIRPTTLLKFSII